MSDTPDNDLSLDLNLLPDWAKDTQKSNPYSNFEGEREDRRGSRGAGGRGGFDGPRRGRDQGRGGPRPGGGSGGPPRGERRDQGQGGPRRRDDRREGGGRPGGPRRGGRPEHGREERAPLPPLPKVDALIIPDQPGVDSLARQIKLSGRAYPLFDIAGLVAQKPERFHIEFSVVREGKEIAQRLFACTLDGTLWLNETEAARHALNRHFDKFYQAEKTPTDPPKGNFQHIGVCGMSGATLGPSNWHGYQAALVRLHTERFSKMPFDAFKARVKTVRDEAQVKQWVDDQSFRTEYVCLGLAEPQRLPSREALELHFKEHHQAKAVQEVESHRLSGTQALALRCPPLREVAFRLVEEQRRFPMKVVNVLSRQFADLGLHFFKRDKTVTFVAVARPSYLDMEATAVSDGIRRIIDFVDATENCSRAKLFAALAPGLLAKAEPAPVEKPATEGAESPAPAPAAPERNPADSAVLADLHWLIHQGHVLEFSNGRMETAKKPGVKVQQQQHQQPKQPKPGKGKRPPIYLPVFMVAPILVG